MALGVDHELTEAGVSLGKEWIQLKINGTRPWTVLTTETSWNCLKTSMNHNNMKLISWQSKWIICSGATDIHFKLYFYLQHNTHCNLFILLYNFSWKLFLIWSIILVKVMCPVQQYFLRSSLTPPSVSEVMWLFNVPSHHQYANKTEGKLVIFYWHNFTAWCSK